MVDFVQVLSAIFVTVENVKMNVTSFTTYKAKLFKSYNSTNY